MQKNDPYWQATNLPEYDGPPPNCLKCKDYLKGGFCKAVTTNYAHAARQVRNPKEKPSWCPKETEK